MCDVSSWWWQPLVTSLCVYCMVECNMFRLNSKPSAGKWDVKRSYYVSCISYHSCIYGLDSDYTNKYNQNILRDKTELLTRGHGWNVYLNVLSVWCSKNEQSIVMAHAHWTCSTQFQIAPSGALPLRLLSVHVTWTGTPAAEEVQHWLYLSVRHVANSAVRNVCFHAALCRVRRNEYYRTASSILYVSFLPIYQLIPATSCWQRYLGFGT